MNLSKHQKDTAISRPTRGLFRGIVVSAVVALAVGCNQRVIAPPTPSDEDQVQQIRNSLGLEEEQADES